MKQDGNDYLLNHRLLIMIQSILVRILEKVYRMYKILRNVRSMLSDNHIFKVVN